MWSIDQRIKDIITETFGESFMEDSPESSVISTVTTYQVRNILLVSTPYDYFLLEEEGRLTELLKNSFVEKDAGYVPFIHHASSGEQARELMKKQTMDLVVLFNIPRDMNVFAFAQQLQDLSAKTPLVFLANNTPELHRIQHHEQASLFDWMFTWQGDGNIFLTIVCLVEDMMSLKKHPTLGNHVLMVDDDIQRYSTLLPLLYEELSAHWNQLTKETLPYLQQTQRQQRRPRILFATTQDEAQRFYKQHQQSLLCILGLSKLMPSLQQPTNGKLIAYETTEKTTSKTTLNTTDPLFYSKIRQRLREQLQLKDLTFEDEHHHVIATARDLYSFERALWSIPENVLLSTAQQGMLVQWLLSRTENELAFSFQQIINTYLTQDKQALVDQLRKQLIDAIQQHKHTVHQGTITKYSRDKYGPHIRFSRIGNGALGGKARGLAFMDKLLSAVLGKKPFKDVTITIPRTLVISTDIFDTFMETNDLYKIVSEDHSDDRIASLFMEAHLPSYVLGDLRDFIKSIRTPLAVRSSSLLEDALFQPFAGVYASMMLPNHTLEVDRRFTELCNAIKFVYASTFFKKARGYLQATSQTVYDEKMGVIIQEIIGTQHNNVFYPTVSGVGRSYNYYPVGRCTNEDGIAHLALGMGKQIVDGGIAYRFCPAHPKIPHYSSQQEVMKYSQTSFYAIDLNAKINITHQGEDDTFVTLPLSKAEEHGELTFVASTFHREDQRLYSGVGFEGPRALDFQPILQDNAVPLATIVNALLKICEASLGTPVEIEYAMTLDPEEATPATFALLQVRSMVAMDDQVQVDVENIDQQRLLCYCQHALGNGTYDNIRDIIYINGETFDLAQTQEVVPAIRNLNNQLIADNRPYALIGPGRWGSADPWLGIPVFWSDIAGVKLMVETPIAERTIEPSEGSHFFQNLSSLRIGYFTMVPKTEDVIYFDRLEKQVSKDKKALVHHIRFNHPLDIRIDGATKQGVILLPEKRKG